MHNTVTFGEVKEAYTLLYSDTIFNSEFSSFDEAFLHAWNNLDYFSGEGELTPDEAAEAMTFMWQLSEG